MAFSYTDVSKMAYPGVAPLGWRIPVAVPATTAALLSRASFLFAYINIEPQAYGWWPVTRLQSAEPGRAIPRLMDYNTVYKRSKY